MSLGFCYWLGGVWNGIIGWAGYFVRVAVTDRLVGGGEVLWMHGRVVIRYCMDGYVERNSRRYWVFI